MYTKIIGFLHLLFAIFISFYAFIFNKNSFDYIYIFYQILCTISWTFYNGECALTYYIKKNKNKNYIAGTESTDLKDMYQVIGSKQLSYYIITICIFISAVSLYIVMKRNKYSNFISILTSLLMLMYTLSLRIDRYNLYKNKKFLFFQEIIKYSLCLVLFYISYIKLI